jgi:hypothetical protein
MSRRIQTALAMMATMAVAAPAHAGALDSLVIDYEGGGVWLGQNDGRYGKDGTLYTSGTVAQNANLFKAERLSGEARFLDRHTVVLLYAPLDVTTRVRLDAPLTFRDTTFASGTVVDSRYLFDGLRASYLYRFFQGGGWTLEGGGTLQIRNAVVSMTDVTGKAFAAERDIGLVPALKARVRYDTPLGPYALWEADGMGTLGIGGSVKGGIFDTALTLGIPVRQGLDVTLRARYLTGGAEVPRREIYNWGQFVALTAGFRVDLASIMANEPKAAADPVRTEPVSSGTP